MTLAKPQPASIREQILEQSGSLSRQQRVIAEYILEHLSEIPFLSIPDLAERTATSEATVVRFCQRIGYTGYSDLKMALVEAVRDDLRSTSRSQVDTEDLSEDLLAAVARLEQLNIERTLTSVDRKHFRSVAAQLFRADHIFTFGLGISAYLADFASYLFTEHGLRSTALGRRFTSPLEQLVVLRPTDCVVAFSFPPYSNQTLEILEESSGRGVPTVVITDRATAPGVALAKSALIVSSHGMTFTNSTSAAGMLLNALVVEIASRHRGETVEALSRINRILSEQTYHVDDNG